MNNEAIETGNLPKVIHVYVNISALSDGCYVLLFECILYLRPLFYTIFCYSWVLIFTRCLVRNSSLECILGSLDDGPISWLSSCCLYDKFVVIFSSLFYIMILGESLPVFSTWIMLHCCLIVCNSCFEARHVYVLNILVGFVYIN